MRLELLRQHIVLVHRSHPSVAVCHLCDRRNAADVTTARRPWPSDARNASSFPGSAVGYRRG
ncbi:hypothetical protein Rhow_006283 [Rhodococcus wratislaviensis]|uniref:Uncharacterized protein n=1 Tax=Rhodococcus wratislaviensis TaxID=44752 RepID=A0A402CFK0_RHOWR|nr:hypothetical protein Rhow_006283 [Rhodococcus wratislaviensis]